jgi:hypothetical protein
MVTDHQNGAERGPITSGVAGGSASASGPGAAERYAEQAEAGGLAMARMLLDRAGAIRRAEPSAEELRYLNKRLVETLREVVEVADARGARLGLPGSDAAFLARFGFPPKDVHTTGPATAGAPFTPPLESF